jgi:RNA polymerase sigma-70 factor (ECF subfamily)
MANVDSAPANLAETKPQIVTDAEDCAVSVGMALVPVKRLLPEALARELWQKAAAELVELSEAEFAEALEAIGAANNFGLDPGIQASEKDREAFWRNLHVEELALARGCALGREAAWQRFLAQYREPLTRIAVDIAGAVSLGEELANSLYSELFGLTERDGKRLSPLFRYSGRGSLMGWLRAVLAQRRVNLYRKTSRDTALDEIDVAAPASESVEVERLVHLRSALEGAISTLSAEERFLLSAYYLDEHKLHEVSRVLQVHEATVSRKLKRATNHVRKELLKALIARGLSRRAAEEALGTDPRDVEINLRKLLQFPDSRAISNKKEEQVNKEGQA